MPWYKTGTVSVVQNSNAVIGTGTAFIANARVGDAFRGPDGGWYEVTNIASDTALSIAPPYLGGTNAAGAYALAPMQGYVKDSADALRALVNQFGGVMAVLGQTPTQSGVRASLNLTNTDGLPEGVTNKYMSGSGVRAITLTGLDLTSSTPVASTDSILSAVGKLQAQVSAGVSPGYIDGLNPIWNSGTSISVDSGTAYIPGSTKALRVSAPLTLSGLSLTANTWYYLYLFENAGNAAIELVATAPAAPYFGTSRTKAGDTSRRFIAAVRCGPSGLRPFLIVAGMIAYADTAALYPVLSGGTATGATAVDATPTVPPTTRSCWLAIYGPSSGGTLSVGVLNAYQLSCAAGNRYMAPTWTDPNQRFVYTHNAAVTGGSVLDVRAYGMER